MITNEQKAHDIALTALSMLPHATIEDDGRISIDVYRDYLGLYRYLLECLERDFPAESSEV